jgi:hypothetical protein
LRPTTKEAQNYAPFELAARIGLGIAISRYVLEKEESEGFVGASVPRTNGFVFDRTLSILTETETRE